MLGFYYSHYTICCS